MSLTVAQRSHGPQPPVAAHPQNVAADPRVGRSAPEDLRRARTSRTFVVRRTLAAGLLPLLAALAGCQGGGHVDVAALNYRDIDPPAPNITRLDLDRCFWWTDEQDHVWIALERDQPFLLGPEHFVFQLSLALDKPPAGRSRNYLASNRELRGVACFGPAQSRFVSMAGIVALYREPGERLRGSFRLDVMRHAQQLLGGWNRAGRYLMLGTFDAVKDEQQGRRIAAATEAHGWDREPPATQPTTQPATQPTSQPAK